MLELETLRLLKQSEKSSVSLVREKGNGRLLIKKVLNGRHEACLALQGCAHPLLPAIYEVSFPEDGTTVVIEEYIEGRPLGPELPERQLLRAMRELCAVLGFLEKHGIVHRDIKPSNILMAADGHIRLIDFDAARIARQELEQDTVRLGTRGYAPPEQYGFSQTDARSDLYALGVTLRQLLGERAQRPRYRRILKKCTALDPGKRYQSARQLDRALALCGRAPLIGGCAVLCLALLLSLIWRCARSAAPEGGLTVLPAPESPHWSGESGIARWGNVPESGSNGEVGYHWKLYRMDTPTPPGPDAACYQEGGMHGNGAIDYAHSTYEVNLAEALLENGYYFFSVCAAGDGLRYADSPFALSDAFLFTGEDAPPLPQPKGLTWHHLDASGGEEQLYATWDNLEDYADDESFRVHVYDREGNRVATNIWTKAAIIKRGHNGIQIPLSRLAGGGSYRFTVQALTSRPNQYRSSPLPSPIPDNLYSPWFERAQDETQNSQKSAASRP